jgi:hypothetical protein
LTFEPRFLRNPHAPNAGISLEHLVVARGCEYVNGGLRVGPPELIDEWTGQHRITQVVKLHNQDSPGRLD